MRVLLVDDDPLVVRAVAELIRRRGDTCVFTQAPAEALQQLQKHNFDLLLSDMVMPGMDGLDLIRSARALQPAMVCILMSGLGTRRDIISALKIGVFDFMDKPMPDAASFNMILDRAAERSRLVRERDALLENLKQQNVKLEFSLQRLHDAFGQLRQQEEELESDLLRAQQVQRRFLPTGFPLQPGLECYGFFGPCEQVGGDFFGAFALPDSQVAAYLLDVAGHGVSAAIVTVTLRELMRAKRRQEPDARVFSQPAAVLAYMNDAVIDEQFDPPVLVTMIYAVFDPRTGRVCIAGAGHPPPLVVASDGAHPLPVPGPVLGAKSSSAYETIDVQLEPDDLLLLYSDGLTEARDKVGDEFKPDRPLEIMQALRGRPAAEVGAALEKRWAEFFDGAPATDDMTFLLFRRTDPALPPVKAGPTVRFAMPEKLRLASPEVRGRVRAGWHGQDCVVAFSGTATWQLAPTLREVMRQAHDGKARAVAIDLAACSSLDSTMLGLLLQLANEVTLHQPGPRAAQQLRDLGILERFTLSDELCPAIEHEMKVARMQSREACSELILSAHEALMAASVDNRMRFQDVVDSMRREIAAPKSGP